MSTEANTRRGTRPRELGETLNKPRNLDTPALGPDRDTLNGNFLQGKGD